MDIMRKYTYPCLLLQNERKRKHLARPRLYTNESKRKKRKQDGSKSEKNEKKRNKKRKKGKEVRKWKINSFPPFFDNCFYPYSLIMDQIYLSNHFQKEIFNSLHHKPNII